MEEDTGMLLAAALMGAVFVVLLVLVTVVLVLRWRRRREAVASTRGFVLFGVCFQDGNQSRVARPSLGRNRRWVPRGAEAAADDQDPDECELERWKKIFGGPTRCLSTIEEGTEKGTTPFTTPASSPDRRDARTLQEMCKLRCSSCTWLTKCGEVARRFHVR